jgi:hypothetical protein
MVAVVKTWTTSVNMGKPTRKAAPPVKQPSSTTEKPERAARRGPQAVSDLVEASLEPTLRARGFASSAIHTHWAEIAGSRLAPWTEPVQLKWPPRPPGQETPRDGATLTIKVEGAFALDLQHMTPQLIDRINSHFGWRCVSRLLLKQGPVRKTPPPQKRPKKVLTPEASRKLDQLIDGIEKPELKAALARLGVGVMGQ